jgi:L-asparaginase
MRTASDAGYEGFANLAGAVQVAASDSARGIGSLVFLNDTLHAARYVTKMNTQSTDAFQSPSWGRLGRLDSDGLQIAWRPIRRVFQVPVLECRVELIKLAVGMEPGVLGHAVGRGSKGIVLETLGGGRVPPWWLQHIRSAVTAGVPVVVASRCPGGRVGDRYGYPGAQRDLRSAGCLPAGCFNGQKARIALMVALGAGLEGSALLSSWKRIAELGDYEVPAE